MSELVLNRAYTDDDVEDMFLRFGDEQPASVPACVNTQDPFSFSFKMREYYKTRNRPVYIVNPLNPVSFSSVTTTPDGQISLSVTGPLGPDYTLLSSTDLMSWSPVLVTNSPVLPFTLVEPGTNSPVQFFRLQIGP